MEEAAKARGIDGGTLAETLLDQILMLETEDLRRTVERANADMEAGKGSDFEEFVRERQAAREAQCG